MENHLLKVAVAAVLSVSGAFATATPITHDQTSPTSVAAPTRVSGDYYTDTPFLLWFFTPCGPDRDGQIQRVWGELWECAFVRGDRPEWQWEPISRIA